MSGEHYENVQYCTVEEMQPADMGRLRDMAADLQELGVGDFAQELRDLVRDVETEQARHAARVEALEERRKTLYPVMRSLNYWRSADSSEGDFWQAVSKLREARGI